MTFLLGGLDFFSRPMPDIGPRGCAIRINFFFLERAPLKSLMKLYLKENAQRLGCGMPTLWMQEGE